MLNPKISLAPDHKSVAQRVINHEARALQALAQDLPTGFSEAIDLIYNKATRLIVCGIGKSGHIARKMAATFSSTGTPSIFVHATEASHGDLGMITEQDVVLLLSNSGESIELNGIIEYCRRFSIPIIGITSSIESTLATNSHIKLLLPAIAEASSIEAPTTSTTMMLALGDAMAIALHEMRGFSVADFKVLHPAGKIGAKLLTVAEIMHTDNNVPVVHEDVSMLEAVLEITNKRLGIVGIVSTEFKLIGVFTDGDLRRHVDMDMKNTKISDVMTRNPITLTKPDILALEALGIMNRNGWTALFMVENNRPVGIIHMHDILRAKVR